MNPIRSLLQLLAALLTLTLPFQVMAQAKPSEIRIDYSYIVPASLIIKRNAWLEEAFKADGVQIKWILSQGSNRALEYLNAGSLDYGSTASLAALVGRANGIPLKTVYVSFEAAQLGILVAKDSPIQSVADLKGKKIASFKGTMPYFYLLSALHGAGISRGDVEIVHLAPNEGQTALESGRVDAWSGLDPFHASSQINAGSRIIATPKAADIGVLNAREEFIQKYPESTKRVLAIFERARHWIIEHPEETAKLIAEEGKQNLAVAKLQLSRQDYQHPIPGPELKAYLKQVSQLVIEEGIVKKTTDINAVIADLIDPSFVPAESQRKNK